MARPSPSRLAFSTVVLALTPARFHLVLLALVVLAIAGCGGSSKDDSSSAPNGFVYPRTSLSAVMGQPIDADTPSINGSGITYSITPTLPSGVTLNSATGSIAGIPTVVSPKTTYSITATNKDGSTSTSIELEVKSGVVPPSSLVYPRSSILAIAGQAIVPDTPTVTGSVDSYSIAPALPAGLLIDSKTGTISGTPTTPSASANYVVTATGAGGTTSATIQITVNVPPPQGLAYPQTAITATVGQAITPDVPTVTGIVDSFNVAPALPMGLIFNTKTGAISGTPAASSPHATYTVTAINATGNTSATIQITVKVAAPEGLKYPQSLITATVGQSITPNVPTVTGTIDSYSVAPALPSGLALDPVTGTISGTPAQTLSPAGSFTITATNASGNTSAVVQILVKQAAPSALAYPQKTINAVVGQAIPALTATVTGTVDAYSVSPALPAGLSLDATSGTISGTPTASAALANYTITASNTSGSTTAQMAVVVQATSGAAPSNLVYPQTTLKTMAGQVVATDIPSLNGMATSFTISPDLPLGLALNATTGSISGSMPSTAQTTTHVITAANASGSTTATVTVQSTPALPILLDLGHRDGIAILRTTDTRVLSQDASGYWLLSDYTTAGRIEGGYAPRPADQPATWPVDMAGQTVAIGVTNGIEIRSANDGHLMATIAGSGIDSLDNPAGAWWLLSSDGSYIAAGSSAGLTVWGADGIQRFSHSGNYATAKAFAAPDDVQIASGPLGTQVIELISSSTGNSTATSAFSGQFNTWFKDGSRFLTNDSSNNVRVYSQAGVQQGTATVASLENLTGQGNWFWTYEAYTPGYPLTIYQVGSATPTATYHFTTDTGVVPSKQTIGIMDYGAGTGSIIDLSGSAPVQTSFTVPTAYNQAYAANSASAWVIGNTHGIVLDGPSASTTTRYFDVGAAVAAAGGGNRAAFATLTEKIYIFTADTSSLEETIPFSSSELAFSADGAVLAAEANTLDNQYQTDRTVNIYSLPGGSVLNSFPYTFSTGFPLDISLSQSGTVLGRLIMGPSPDFTVTRDTIPVTGGVSTFIDTPLSGPYQLPVYLTPDGNTAVVSTSPEEWMSTADIYSNGTKITSLLGSFAIGWIDADHFLTKTFSPPTPHVSSEYLRSTIYDKAGTKVGDLALPNLAGFQPISSTSIFSNGIVYSLSTALPVFTPSEPVDGAPTISNGFVIYVSGTKILVENSGQH